MTLCIDTVNLHVVLNIPTYVHVHVFTGDMVSPMGKWFMDHIHE